MVGAYHLQEVCLIEATAHEASFGACGAFALHGAGIADGGIGLVLDDLISVYDGVAVEVLALGTDVDIPLGVVDELVLAEEGGASAEVR